MSTSTSKLYAQIRFGDQRYYTPTESIYATGLSRTTIWGHIRTGRLPSVKIGGRRLVAKRDLQVFVSGEPSVALHAFRSEEET
jgi:excisionase family DNA binding protein